MTALAKLSPENLQRALGIVAENNPSFESTQVEVVLDLDAQVCIVMFTVNVIHYQIVYPIYVVYLFSIFLGIHVLLLLLIE